jgi:hypothetical protein
MKLFFPLFTAAAKEASSALTTFTGSIKQVLEQKEDLVGIRKLIIQPTKKDARMKDLVEFLSTQSHITSLALSAPEEEDILIQSELAEGLTQLKSLTHLQLDGTTLSSRNEADKKGLLILFEGIAQNKGLTHIHAITRLRNITAADYYPVCAKSAELIGNMAATNQGLKSLDFRAFWLPAKFQDQLAIPLQTIEKPGETTHQRILSIKFENLVIDQSNIATLAIGNQEKNTIGSDIRSHFASKQTLYKS